MSRKKETWRAKLNAPYIMGQHVWRNHMDDTVCVGLVLEHDENRKITLVLSQDEAHKLARQLGVAK